MHLRFKSGGPEELNCPGRGQGQSPDRRDRTPGQTRKRRKPVVENPRGGNGWACTREGERETGNTTRQPHPGKVDHWLN